MSQPLARVTSLKVKLGLLVVASVVVAALVGSLGRAGGVPGWLGIPVTILLALAVTQLLAAGMTSPLRQMTEAARRMATGDYAVRVTDTSGDEVGELARAFNTMAGELDAVDRQRRELVANVSHELRTPLAGLCAVLENVVDGVGPGDPQTLRTALDQAERTSRLVEDLLDLARVDAGKAPLHPQPVLVLPLLEDSVAEARLLGRYVEHEVRVEPADLVLRADPDRLRQLVANLLDNASRHSPAGGSVLVTAAQEDARLVLEVHDQGPGVAAADRGRVFEPFGTLSATEGGGGTGLGLAIARWVTDLHGGSIRFVDPGPDRPGGRVRVDLPVEPPDRPLSARPTTRLPEAGMPTVVPPAPAAPAPRGPVTVAPRSLLDDLFGSFWPDRGVPAAPLVLLGAVVTGVLGGALLPWNGLGLGLFLALVAAGATVLLASPHKRDPFTLACAGLCTLLAVVVVVRDAEWIAVLSVLAGAALCVIGGTRGRTLPGFVLAGVCWPLSGLRGLPWLGRTLARLTGLGRGAALLRTVVLSVLGLLVFGALLSSADALLAEWVDAALPDLTLGGSVLRVFVGVAVGGAVLAAAYLSLNPPVLPAGARPARPLRNRFEWLAPVLVVDAVFAAWLVAQATVVFGGHDYLQRTTGLTYADYVHQGFGQLTVATALTLVVIWAAARRASRETTADRLWLRVSLGLLCVQTLVVVASALYRMDLYQEAYGFTQLRLLVDVFEGWLGVLVLAVLVGGLTLRAAWLARFAVLTGAVALLGIAAINPDAWIADRNLERYAETGRIDWTYLGTLSDDAVPVLADLPDDQRRCALAGRSRSDDGLWEWNLGRARAGDRLPAQADTTALAAGCVDTP